MQLTAVQWRVLPYLRRSCWSTGDSFRLRGAVTKENANMSKNIYHLLTAPGARHPSVRDYAAMASGRQRQLFTAGGEARTGCSQASAMGFPGSAHDSDTAGGCIKFLVARRPAPIVQPWFTLGLVTTFIH
jgi:hypothetical protein